MLPVRTQYLYRSEPNRFPGWICATSWQASVASIAFLAGTMIQGLLVLNESTYVFERWHGTLLVLAITTFAIIFNTFLGTKLPIVQNCFLAIHLIGLVAIIVPMWVLGPRASAKEVFIGGLYNGGGWNSIGTSTLIGLLTPLGALLGMDCSVHMCMWVIHPNKNTLTLSS